MTLPLTVPSSGFALLTALRSGVFVVAFLFSGRVLGPQQRKISMRINQRSFVSPDVKHPSLPLLESDVALRDFG